MIQKWEPERMGYQVKGARQHHAARLLAYHVKKAAEIPPAYSTISLYVTSLMYVKLRLDSGKGTTAVK
jgi:hypothetical protein